MTARTQKLSLYQAINDYDWAVNGLAIRSKGEEVGSVDEKTGKQESAAEAYVPAEFCEKRQSMVWTNLVQPVSRAALVLSLAAGALTCRPLRFR